MTNTIEVFSDAADTGGEPRWILLDNISESVLKPCINPAAYAVSKDEIAIVGGHQKTEIEPLSAWVNIVNAQRMTIRCGVEYTQQTFASV